MIIKKVIGLASLLLLYISNSANSQITYSEHIAPVIYKNCTGCHRQGEIGYTKGGPFTNYTEVAYQGAMIKAITQSRQMPPWIADPSYKHMVGERRLTEDQIKLIADWVDSGMLQGDPKKEPELPKFTNGSQLGTPDLVLKMDKNYVQKGNNKDEYRCFVLPTGLIEDKDVSAIEVRCGNKSIIHHVLFALDTRGIGRKMDSLDPEYGYESFSGFGDDNLTEFAGYAPGANPIVYPNKVAYKFPKNSDLLMQIHYAPLSAADSDLSYVNIYFSKEKATRYMDFHIMVPWNCGVDFIIPPNQTPTFHGTYNITEDLTIFGTFPHAHKLGKAWKVFAVTSDNDTMNIIAINNWDFNWQNTYYFQKPIILRQGSVVHAFGTYDNTINNPNNPNKTPIQVEWGLRTIDEMYYLPLYFTQYQAGDENLVLNVDEERNIYHYDSYNLSLYPIPANDILNIEFNIDSMSPLELNIKSIDGKNIANIAQNKSFPLGRNIIEFNCNSIICGEYHLEIKSQEFTKLSKFIVER